MYVSLIFLFDDIANPFVSPNPSAATATNTSKEATEATEQNLLMQASESAVQQLSSVETAGEESDAFTPQQHQDAPPSTTSYTTTTSHDTPTTSHSGSDKAIEPSTRSTRCSPNNSNSCSPLFSTEGSNLVADEAPGRMESASNSLNTSLSVNWECFDHSGSLEVVDVPLPWREATHLGFIVGNVKVKEADSEQPYTEPPSEVRVVVVGGGRQ